MAVLVAVGVMDLRAMALVTAAIALERLGPARVLLPRAIGIAVVAAVLLITRA
jgi:predicted metal-binding membrane protein